MNLLPELLAPAGNWDCLRAAIANGADAVYFGLPRFNARMRADNFSEEQLPEVVTFSHRHGVRAYVVFNTLVFTDELADAADYLRVLNRTGVDAIIVQDIGLVRLARRIVPELPIHASTQMTVTSPEGAEIVHRELEIQRVILARELSLREIEKFQAETGRSPVELESFVHGALCVAYSGQCLTSESLGRRSANRGECAQACRMPYELVVDGELRPLGDKRYLLSPHDLAAVADIPALIEHGVVSFKIEGRLKSPEYVAAVCQVYRKAIDAALAHRAWTPDDADLYQLEMTFSRGLGPGWLHGADHQRLVSARFGKKRGPFAGKVGRVGRDFVELAQLEVPLKPGDGIVFDTGGDPDKEQGGRIFEIRDRRLFFKHDHIDFTALQPGHRVWKTDDPALNAALRKSYTGNISARNRDPVDLTVAGRAGEPLRLTARFGPNQRTVAVASTVLLQAARNAPLTQDKLREHLGRFGESAFTLGVLRNELEGEVILPIGELNRVRRELVAQLEERAPRAETSVEVRQVLAEIAQTARQTQAVQGVPPEKPRLAILCRSVEQVEAVLALAQGAESLYLDFEDVRRYRDAVSLVRSTASKASVFLATPRIQKAGEEGFFKLIENASPDGVLVRNLGGVEFFGRGGLRRIGDFSLNVSNPLTAEFFMQKGLERITISYDLNITQVLALLRQAPPDWFEVTIHQHMPMFHMEHCVFAAFMSNGSTFLDCGRPCDTHRVRLRDRVGMEHPLRADAGCRNTLFNAVAQTGASFFEDLAAAGLRRYRIELLDEDAAETQCVVRAYQVLLSGEQNGEQLWRELKAHSQLGVTRGTYRETE